ncbi:MAG: hypothetical protein AAGB04_20920 [Pseudomonadota bacterium]
MKSNWTKLYRTVLQHWLYFDRSIDKWSILDYVLPEYQKITEAPLRLEEMPGYSSKYSIVERERFKLKALALERNRRYKAMDADGNIYLVGNPWARRLETREDGSVWIVHPKPRRIMTYAQAKRVAVRRMIDLSKTGPFVSNARQQSDTE